MTLRVLVTGADGFVGKSLCLRLEEQGDIEIFRFVRTDRSEKLPELIAGVDAVVHLAGENRPADPKAFEEVNAVLTRRICTEIASADHPICLILASSTQATRDNPYGRSKLAAEKAAEAVASEKGYPVAIYRLPGLFGKWCKPNYNSVVATFCHNVAHNLPIRVDDVDAIVDLAYIDDVIDELLFTLRTPPQGLERRNVRPVYQVKLGELASQLSAFRDSRQNLITEPVGSGFVRALYATYISYLPPAEFSYSVPRHGDPRGVFVEMLKTRDSGQFSFFTAHPGVTRGGHYHHTKSEKFLVISGTARFGFRDLLNNKKFDLIVDGGESRIVETIPGWTHDITNVGEDPLVVMLWANEIFDRSRPDTVACKV